MFDGFRAKVEYFADLLGYGRIGKSDFGGAPCVHVYADGLRDAEVRGRNERITFEKRERGGDSLPPLRNGGSFEPDADYSPIFGNRRRRSVWDL